MSFSCFIWNMSINHTTPPANLETIIKPFLPGSGSEYWGCQGPCGWEMLLCVFSFYGCPFRLKEILPLGSWVPVFVPIVISITNMDSFMCGWSDKKICVCPKQQNNNPPWNSMSLFCWHICVLFRDEPVALMYMCKTETSTKTNETLINGILPGWWTSRRISTQGDEWKLVCVGDSNHVCFWEPYWFWRSITGNWVVETTILIVVTACLGSLATHV